MPLQSAACGGRRGPGEREEMEGRRWGEEGGLPIAAVTDLRDG